MVTCEMCEYYINNCDTESECQGQDVPCHEFIYDGRKFPEYVKERKPKWPGLEDYMRSMYETN